MSRFVVISGCSGGGKSSLLAEFRARGFGVVEEPGRRIVAREIASGGSSLPWLDAEAFIRRAIAMSLADIAAARQLSGWVFFDRGLIDAAAGLERLIGEPIAATLDGSPRFHRQIFLTPPWPEIYSRDSERRHGLDEAIEEYRHLLKAYPKLGYDVTVLAKASVSERAEQILSALSAD
jgi:predicted ATPase